MADSHRKKAAFFFSSFRAGGIEKMRLNLAAEFIRRGIAVDLVIVSGEGVLRDNIPHGARVIDLESSRTITAIPALIRYFRATPPDALLVSQTQNNAAAVFSRWITKANFQLTVTEHTDLSMVIKNKSVKEKARPLAARFFYPFADAIVAVSAGAAIALSRTAGIRLNRITVINNPVFSPAILTLSKEKIEHPWLNRKQSPVIIAVGRLTDAKDYPTLLKALAIVGKKRNVKCIILGEGELRDELQAQISQLALGDAVDLHGFVDNPYAFLSKADLFVLSSKREGFPNVLVEAMACGAPVVATDCPSGPAEILDKGKYGPLVPVGDAQALADAMLKTLDDHLPAETLITRARQFSVEKIADQYLQILFPD